MNKPKVENESEECEHEEHDHFICIECGAELDPGEFIDQAMDRMDLER